MPVKKLKEFLDSNKVKYVTIDHSVAYTAQEIAAVAHVPGNQLAKVVIVKLDGEDAMVVLPAGEKVNLDRLLKATGASKAELANESDFKNEFKGCELGAMPPFGNLYDMDVYVADGVSNQKEIAFNAGTHSQLIRLAYADFEKLVKPKKVVLT